MRVCKFDVCASLYIRWSNETTACCDLARHLISCQVHGQTTSSKRCWVHCLFLVAAKHGLPSWCERLAPWSSFGLPSPLFGHQRFRLWAQLCTSRFSKKGGHNKAEQKVVRTRGVSFCPGYGQMRGQSEAWLLSRPQCRGQIPASGIPCCAWPALWNLDNSSLSLWAKKASITDGICLNNRQQPSFRCMMTSKMCSSCLRPR